MEGKEAKGKVLEVQDILECLPHRYPFLLIDRVLDYEPHKYIRAIKNVTFNEPFFGGHFPGHPVMPGVLIVEAMAQAAAVLAHYSVQKGPSGRLYYYFAGINEVRFKRPVVPGDQLFLEINLIRLMRGVAKFEGRATVADNVACEGGMLCSIREEALF